MLMELGKFVNEFGYEEKYMIKDISVERTGHINRHSDFYSSNDCSNCDGSLCDSCKKQYIVRKYSKPIYVPDLGYNEIKVLQKKVFTNIEYAIEFYDEL